MSEYTCLQCTQDCHGESARQARTIRRLFTAYFLVKGQVKNVNACLAFALERHARFAADVHENVIPDSVQAGRYLERARIVAALRAKVCANTSPYWDREATALGIVADAIERGEL